MKRSHNFIDLTGKKFGSLTVEKEGSSDGNFISWWCICDCGNKTIVRGMHLKQGTTTSCGCKKKEAWNKYYARGRKASMAHIKYLKGDDRRKKQSHIFK